MRALDGPPAWLINGSALVVNGPDGDARHTLPLDADGHLAELSLESRERVLLERPCRSKAPKCALRLPSLDLGDIGGAARVCAGKALSMPPSARRATLCWMLSISLNGCATPSLAFSLKDPSPWVARSSPWLACSSLWLACSFR